MKPIFAISACAYAMSDNIHQLSAGGCPDAPEQKPDRQMLRKKNTPFFLQNLHAQNFTKH